MSSGFKDPITIKETINNITARKFLLPAIQRKFVWSNEQIEVLFDSIMRGYPINSFMFWEVTSDTIKNNFKFYEFIQEYRQKFKEDNPGINTVGRDNFTAVIDGQQRLTSLFIGLTGSFAYKMPRRWWYDNQDSIPSRFLYLNLAEPKIKDNELKMKYDFQFFTDSEINAKKAEYNSNWFLINDVLKIRKEEDMDEFIDQNGWDKIPFTKKTFRKLWRVVHTEKLINYYQETTQEIDTVLDIFIRTNAGGEPLTFSDLLMSITTAQWIKLDARKEISDLVKEIFSIGSPGFIISKDLILKTCLVLFNDNIKFSIKNFDHSNVINFENNWIRIKKCIVESFQLLAGMGFNNHVLRAKNAVIPIVYYIYHRNLAQDINNPIRHKKDKALIRKWLCLSLLKGVFGGQSDNVLSGTKKAIAEELKANNNKASFPLKRIKEHFKSNAAKNLSLDDELIESILKTQKDDSDAFMILSLIYPHIDYTNQKLHKDHMYPADYFRKLKEIDFTEKLDYEFYSNPENWNSILNLQLLNEHLNTSKHAKRLEDWVNDENINKNQQLIPENISLNESNFPEFIQKRKEKLKTKLKKLVA